MATPLTGSMGWSGLHPFQLGGPPLVSTWSRPLAQTALPLIAHVYENDGVTSKGLLQLNKRPAVKATTVNGICGPVTLEIAQQSQSSIYGQATYGVATYGAKVVQGNVIRLTEDGGPYPGFIYSGIVESLPDARSQTVHQIVLAPFGKELERVASQSTYTTGVDIVVAVRDAVAMTQHCHCDQVSVPVSTGIPLLLTQGATVDFSGQMVNQVLDTLRSMAGPTWYWYCDELGRVWFQPQGSGAVYTLKGGVHYKERVTNGGDIADRKNQVPAVGGAPPGSSANIQLMAPPLGTLSASQRAIGIRTLNPPIHAPGITDPYTLRLLANGILATLDQTWNWSTLTVLPATGQPNEVHPGRIHHSQPGGGTVRFWEPTVNAMPESGHGTGYSGPFILQSHSYDGQLQTIEVGNIPVTSQTDVANMVAQWATRAASWHFRHTPITLGDPQQVMTGTLQVGSVMVGGQTFGRMELGILQANGISPAQAGWRTNGPDGGPFADSVLGLIKGLTVLASNFVSTAFPTTSTTPVLITGSGVTVNPANQVRVLVLYGASVAYTGNTAFVDLFVDGSNQSGGGNGPALELQFPTTSSGAVTSMGFFTTTLSAASHTVDLRASQNGVGTATVEQCALVVLQLGIV